MVMDCLESPFEVLILLTKQASIHTKQLSMGKQHLHLLKTPRNRSQPTARSDPERQNSSIPQSSHSHQKFTELSSSMCSHLLGQAFCTANAMCVLLRGPGPHQHHSRGSQRHYAENAKEQQYFTSYNHGTKQSKKCPVALQLHPNPLL